MIPKIIYKTGPFKEANLPITVKSIFKQTIRKNPGYQIEYYDDDRCREFLSSNYPPEVLESYDNIIPGAYKADLFRYCILYKKGGIYTDLPLHFLIPISSLIDHEKNDLVLVDDMAHPTIPNPGIQISFMAAIPNHPVYKKAIEMAVETIKNKEYGVDQLDVMGPKSFRRVVNITNTKYRVDLIQHDNDYLKFKINNELAIKTRVSNISEECFMFYKYKADKNNIKLPHNFNYMIVPDNIPTTLEELEHYHYSTLWKMKKIYKTEI
jgi:mannosyltransferase OCH1-like enzyme